MAIAEHFIRNLKGLVGKKSFNEQELQLILVTAQECATLSPVEMISLLDHVDEVIDLASLESSDADLEQTRKDLFEEEPDGADQTS